MSRPLRIALITALSLIVLAALALLVDAKIPPRAARLLPEADAIVYANLQPIRAATHLDRTQVPHSPDYQHFIDSTGIVFERDLDSVAFALHHMPDASGPNGAVAFSEVFLGRFDPNRLTQYLASVATGQETYAGHRIYTVPIALPDGPASHIAPTGRVLRVAVLGTGTIAASNAPTPEQIHAMLDRHRASLNPLAGPTLLGGLYPEVPLFADVWGIGAIGLPFADNGRVTAFGLHLPLADTTPFVASLRYLFGLQLRVEQIASTEAEAAHSTQKLTALLALFRATQPVQPILAGDTPLRQMLDSLRIQEHGDRAILTAEVPLPLLRRLTTPMAAIAGLPPSTQHASNQTTQAH